MGRARGRRRRRGCAILRNAAAAFGPRAFRNPIAFTRVKRALNGTSHPPGRLGSAPQDASSRQAQSAASHLYNALRKSEGEDATEL